MVEFKERLLWTAQLVRVSYGDVHVIKQTAVQSSQNEAVKSTIIRHSGNSQLLAELIDVVVGRIGGP